MIQLEIHAAQYNTKLHQTNPIGQIVARKRSSTHPEPSYQFIHQAIHDYAANEADELSFKVSSTRSVQFAVCSLRIGIYELFWQLEGGGYRLRARHGGHGLVESTGQRKRRTG